MSAITKHILAAVTAAIMITAVLAGCGGGDDESIFMPPEFVYVAQSVLLPGSESSNINATAISDGTLYFVMQENNYDEETSSYTINSRLYSMGVDSPDAALLTNYKPPLEVPDGANGGVYINTMNIDGDGNIWVIERYDFYVYNLPEDFNPETGRPWEYYESLGSGMVMRKLSPDGTELLQVDLDGISGQVENLYINTFNIDGAGNVYIPVDDWERGGYTIYVIDSSGSLQFSLSSDNWINMLIRLRDGTIAFVTNVNDENGYRTVLKTIDFAAKAFGATYDLPQNSWQVYPGGGEYDILISDDENIYGFVIGGEERVRLLNWIDSDILNNGIQGISMLNDGRIVCASSSWNSLTNEQTNEMLIFTKTPYSELPEKTVITLAALGSWAIRDAVVSFNKSSDEYRIQVIDYQQYNTNDDYTAGLTRLSTEIISGKVPDIIALEALPYEEYVEKGLLAELYHYIDSDPGISRGDLVEGAFKAAEVDGGLYQIFPTFNVQTLAGHPSHVGPGIGWNLEEFKAFLDANPDTDMPLGQWLTKTAFLQSAISFGLDAFIDWGTGKTSFDSPEFINLLEYSNSLPDDIDYDKVNWDDFYVPEEEAIATGRQLMAQMYLNDFYSYMYYKEILGGEIVFKGFPNEHKNGNSLSVNACLGISEKSKNKDAAWSFLRKLLEYDFQRSNYRYWGFPTNKRAFNDLAGEAMAMHQGSYTYNSISIAPPTQSDIDAIVEVINSAHGTSGWNIDQTIWEIINEGASDYFKGASSAQDVARVIQSRLSILVSERS